MFPSIRIRVTGLEPGARYFVMVEAVLNTGSRYKFSAAEWTAVGSAEPQSHPSTRLYIHPDSPALGSSWMAQDVLFHRAKLTNNPLDRSGNLVLTSMHKYQPRIHIVKASDVLAVHWSPTATFTFPETEFIAVTAYQNEKITKLKIDNNPFAKGFRENGQAKTKRKMQVKDEEDINEYAVSCNNCCYICVSEVKKSCHGGVQDDSGISVGSATPPLDVETTSCAGGSPPPPSGSPPPLVAQVPPPAAFYPPHTFWPYSPFLLSAAYAPPPTYLPYHFPYSYPFHPPPPPPEAFLVDLTLRPTDYSLKHHS
ncbi:hypothetical protein AAG570_010138 [Ranatra chinensis]|uniref:T-box domain-containing protein n=1 Tax=Ranatra chinensis TaxID=642074 RepID=A0ABD0YLN6_9HEMI